MNRKLPTSNIRNGFATLPIVLVIALLLQLIGIAVLFMSRFSIQRSQQFYNSQQSLFAAEGALNDWILQFAYEPQWMSKSSYSDTVNVGGVVVQRSFTYDDVSQTYHITIQSNNQGAKRKLVADYQALSDPDSESYTPVDLVLILDRSGSMSSSIEQLKSAVKDLISSTYLTDQDRVAIVDFATEAELVTTFTSDKNELLSLVNKVKVDAIGTTGKNIGLSTNITSGLIVSKSEVESSGRSEAQKYILLFSDGSPNHTIDDYGNKISCPNEACIDYASFDNYLPDNAGNHCTDGAIRKANVLKNSSMQIFGIYYVNDGGSECGNLNLTRELNRKTVQEIVTDQDHYFETDDKKELEEIFKQIGRQIEETRQTRLEYQEVEPDEG